MAEANTQLNNIDSSVDNCKQQSGQTPKKSESGFKTELFEWLECIVFSLVAVVLIFTFIFRIVGVDGRSMVPTLQDQDRLVISHLFYTPKQGDIIVITQPTAVNEPLIKRIIAKEGQVVDIDFSTGTVYVDGTALSEPYINELTTNSATCNIELPVTVPEGKVFVMGDNRNNSRDSRDSSIGMIDERYILGKAFFRIYPFSDIGPVE